jgi:hypothetical protein
MSLPNWDNPSSGAVDQEVLYESLYNSRFSSSRLNNQISEIAVFYSIREK